MITADDLFLDTDLLCSPRTQWVMNNKRGVMTRLEVTNGVEEEEEVSVASS